MQSVPEARNIVASPAERRAAALAELVETAHQMRLLSDKIASLQSALAEVDNEPGASQDSVGHGEFRRAVMAILKGAYPEKLSAAQVRERVHLRLGREYHEKTTGMTLTRLKKEGLVALDGRQWYFLPGSDLAP